MFPTAPPVLRFPTSTPNEGPSTPLRTGGCPELPPQGPDPDAIQRVQRIRKLTLLAAITTLVGVASLADTRGSWPLLDEALAVTSLLAIGVAIIGRAWCSLYIGGRKKSEIVDLGPYSLSRNPLYLFSFIGAFGMGAQSGSLVLALGFVAVAVIVFTVTVEREEAWLSAAFGQTYARYAERTPRFWPRLAGWRDAEMIDIRPAYFIRTLLDGSAMLLAIPLFAALELARDAEILPTVLYLP